MPQGKGTYGKQRGRPKKKSTKFPAKKKVTKRKAKGMTPSRDNSFFAKLNRGLAMMKVGNRLSPMRRGTTKAATGPGGFGYRTGQKFRNMLGGIKS